MKRSLPAIVLLLITVTVTYLGTNYVDQKSDELIEILQDAHEACHRQDYDKVIQILDAYQQTFDRDEFILMLVVRHDMLSELMRIAAPLENYAYEETEHDFCIEANRAIEQLSLIRDAQFRLI